jgi:hypothetical protein
MLFSLSSNRRREFQPEEHGRSPVSHPTCDVPLPPRRTGEYRKGMIPVRPLYQGVRGSVWIPKPRESGSVIGADRRRSGPSCVLPKGVPQGQTESGGIGSADICWATSAQRRCHPQEALYLPSFSHLFDCQLNKLFSLSLPLSLSLPTSHPSSLTHTLPPSFPRARSCLRHRPQTRRVARALSRSRSLSPLAPSLSPPLVLVLAVALALAFAFALDYWPVSRTAMIRSSFALAFLRSVLTWCTRCAESARERERAREKARERERERERFRVCENGDEGEQG